MGIKVREDVIQAVNHDDSSSVASSDEQNQVVESQARRLTVEAFSGAGKTTTLVKYAQARPDKSITYLAFNRATKEEGGRRFPSNTRSVTMHGLAYRKYGAPFESKLGNPRAGLVAGGMGVSAVVAGYAIETVNSFFQSASSEISELHISTSTPVAERGRIMDAARALWKMMQDRGNNGVPMTHDGYLKLYHLAGERIDSDIVLLDEAQDANPVILDVLSKQQCDRVLVGDRHQAIYAFRGAIDGLGTLPADQRLALTESWRFGPGIAAIATALLHDLTGEQKVIKGMGKHKSRFSVDKDSPHTKIARTNAGLFDAAVDLYDAGVPFGFVGGAGGYRLDLILDAFHLQTSRPEQIKDRMLRSFGSWGAMEQYAEALEDRELMMLMRVVSAYRSDIPALVKGIASAAREVLTGQEVVLTTAHKSKGLEWDAVVLVNDYPDLIPKPDKKGGMTKILEEEVNIMYVAATRAKQSLQPNEMLSDWLHLTGRDRLLKPGHGGAQPATHADGVAVPSMA